jgi:penicillin-binding protein 2
LTGIGQGDVLATPVQMANLACFVANEGTTYRPHLVKAFRGHNTSQVAPEVVHQVDLPAGDWRQIKDAMVGVVDHGTAAGSRIPGLAWGGKTGSAEVHGQAKTNSWFIGFAPAIRPKIAICVMVEAVGHGSEYAAPIARRVVESYLRPASAFSKSSNAR